MSLLSIDELIEILKEKNEPVPTPSRLPTPEEVEAAEKELSFTFPSDFRRFLLEASNIVYGLREPGRILPDLPPYICLRKITQRAWEAGVPSNCIAFCSDNGNYFTLNEGGAVSYTHLTLPTIYSV